MFMVFKKKQMILTALVLMLGIAGYLNYRYDVDTLPKTASLETGDITEPEIGETVMVNSEVKEKPEEDDIFSAEKIKRDAARAKTREELTKLLSAEGVSQDVKDETQRKLTNIAGYEEAEVTAQDLLKAKGYAENMVYISDESVTVTVRQDGISKSDTAKIVDIIFELTKNNNIKIVEVE